MPPTGAEAKVKDLEYKNWLRVGLALNYLKVGLCSFIQGEVDAMHQSLLQKLYGGSAVPASRCSSCNSKDVKQNRYSYTWKFLSPCPHRLCDTWLTELLAFHTNPTSSKLYWENCDVTVWPHASWECAKLYMPRGQPATNTGPAQSDSQALLTLMASCTYFHSKLSQRGIQLTRTVSNIRNRVMHSEDMSLSDSDRNSFIQEIINLLEDPFHLKSLEECKQAVVEINKINNDSLDVFFNIDLEMKALSECVNDCRQELGVHKVETEKTVESLKEDFTNLKVQFDSFEKETKDKFGNLDTKCQEMGTTVSNLSRTMVNVTSGLKHVQRQVRKQSSRCSVIKKNVYSLRRKAVTVQSQQNKRLRKLGEEMRLIKGITSQASRATVTAGKVSQENIESDVRDIQLSLIKAYESVKIISVSPAFDTTANWKDLEDFYTDIVIEVEQEESAQRRKDKQQINKEIVMSFRQVFEKGDKKVTRIILKAPAGQGKSTFCRKLVHTWCSVQKNKLNIPIDAGISDKSEANGLKDDDEMLRFDVLLYICLRDISDEKTLMDVIYTQFPLHESQGLSHKSLIEALIGQEEDNKVLLIMDGLDEMDNSSSFIEKIMQRRLYPHLTVLATTRPWKIDQLRLVRSAHIDLFLDLQGFNDANSMLFAKKILDKYYKDESAIAQFQQNIQKNSVIKSLIHVPLLLLFIVHVWYEKKSFPQTIHELYMEILNVMMNRYMEGNEQKEKSKGRQDEKKYLLPKTYPLESTTFVVPCKLGNLSLVQHFGEGFLAALCEVANHFLITNAKENSLVFEEKALLKLLGKDGLSKLQTALDLGILSNSESLGILRKKICVSFLHKTVQEFLAAINICCREDRCNIFLDSLNTLNDVFQNEKIIIFVAGISTVHSQKISEKIYEVCDKDRTRGVSALSRLYRNCIREACGEPVNLKLYCVYADNQEDWNVLHSALWSISNVRTQLKCLKLDGCTLDDATLDLSEITCLEYLSLEDVTMKGKLLLSKCTQLKRLELQNCSLDDATLDLLESNCLKYLSLEDVTMKGKLLLSKCTQLKRLELQNCSLDDATLDLLESNCLKYLSLEDVTMKGQLLLSKCTQLKRLELQKCRLDDATLDLLESNCLKYLSLEDVTMKGKLLLSKCTQLKRLELQNCSLDDATLDLLESNCLKYLSLEDVTMKGQLLLSKCTQLKCLELQKCRLDDATLDLLESNCLKYLSLEDVTMKGKLLLSKCTQLKRLELQNCSLDDATLDLSESHYLKYLILKDVTMKGKLLDLDDALFSHDSVNDVNEFTLVNVTMSKECQEVLCNSLSRCKELCTLSIKNVDLCDALLRLDNVNKLDEFTLDNVTMNKECKEVLCKSLSQCIELCTLSIKNVDLGDALLSLDGIKCFNELNLHKVTMSKECKEVFCNSLSKCKQLCTLSIKNVDICDVPLRLDNVNELDEFILDNVTMSKECMEVLCKSLSKCKQLCTLSIKNVDLCDALLSLDGIKCLNELNLHKVTMSEECKEVLCDSLSKCKALCTLSIKKVDLGDALLRLDSVNRFDEFTLDNVTMSKECMEVLCDSLSKCKKLCTLSIKNVDLGDAQLSLDGIKCLNELNLHKVTMRKECKEVFCNSLSKCKQLRTLSIKNVDLGDALLSLDGIKCLNELNLHKVTMSKECKEVLCDSLSKCEALCTLSIKKVDLGDALLRLDSVNRFDEFTLDNVTMSKECMEVLCKILSKCKKLRTLSIKNVDLGDAQLSLDGIKCLNELNLHKVTMSKECKEVFCNSLSKCKQLCTLSIKNVDICDVPLRLDNVNELDEFTLDNVTMSKECMEVLCKSLSKCKQLCTLSIKNVDLCDAILSLDSVNELDEFTLDNITMSKECQEVLCNSLSQCKELCTLSIKNVDLCDALLGLDNVNKLDEFTLDNVTMNKECKKVLCKRLSQCKELCTLSIRNVDLGNAQLNLDGINCFNELNLHKVTMSKECKEVFCNSLSKCKKLCTLSIKNVDICDVLLRLDSVNELDEFTLDNVTMSKECKKLLCNSLSQCKQLRTLSIKNVDLCDALLSLDGIKYLKELNLHNVTMTIDSKRMLFKSLSKSEWLGSLSIANMDLDDEIFRFFNFHSLYKLELDNVTKSIESQMSLKDLSLKNLDCSDGLHELYNMNRLTNIALDNVKMDKTSKVFMCKILSPCTKLRALSLKNLDLGDGLSLNNLEMLHSLTIDNVTMCKDGYVILCNSMSRCTQLKDLQLMNLDLGDAKPTFDNLDGLELVDITISLQHVDYIKSSVQHLKSLYHYSSEHTRQLIIEKAADSCEKCVVNFTNKRVLDDDVDEDADDDGDDFYCSDDDDYYMDDDDVDEDDDDGDDDFYCSDDDDYYMDDDDVDDDDGDDDFYCSDDDDYYMDDDDDDDDAAFC